MTRADIEHVHMDASRLGGIVVRLVDYDGRTIYFQRVYSLEHAEGCLRAFNIEPPPRQ